MTDHTAQARATMSTPTPSAQPRGDPAMNTSVSYIDPIKPDNKMRLYPTKVINILGGPGCDKAHV